MCITLVSNLHSLSAAVMRSDGFEYLKENCPSLQSELLKTVAGCEEDCSSGGKSRSVWAQLSDGGDTNGRRVRQRTWDLMMVGLVYEAGDDDLFGVVGGMGMGAGEERYQLLTEHSVVTHGGMAYGGKH